MIKAAGFRFTPKGATKVSDKNSDAVAYLFTTAQGNPAAKVFFAKQTKPVLNGYFLKSKTKTAEQVRAERVAELFASRQASIAYKAEQKAKENAKGRGVEVGQFLKASWGYDQTNVNFYKVTKLIGESMAEVVEVGKVSVGSENALAMSDYVIPSEKPKDTKAYRVKLKAGSGTINGQRVSAWSGSPAYTSWYA